MIDGMTGLSQELSRAIPAANPQMAWSRRELRRHGQSQAKAFMQRAVSRQRAAYAASRVGRPRAARTSGRHLRALQSCSGTLAPSRHDNYGRSPTRAHGLADQPASRRGSGNIGGASQHGSGQGARQPSRPRCGHPEGRARGASLVVLAQTYARKARSTGARHRAPRQGLLARVKEHTATAPWRPGRGADPDLICPSLEPALRTSPCVWPLPSREDTRTGDRHGAPTGLMLSTTPVRAAKSH